MYKNNMPFYIKHSDVIVLFSTILIGWTIIGLGLPITIIILKYNWINKNSFTDEEINLFKKPYDVEQLSAQELEVKENIKNLNNNVDNIKRELDIFNEELMYSDFGIYKPPHYYDLSESYKEKWKEIETQIKELVKNKDAYAILSNNFSFNNSLSKGRKMQNDIGKNIVRMFLNESEDNIKQLSITNYNKKVEKVEKLFDKINTKGYNVTVGVTLTGRLKRLVLEKLELMMNYKLALEEEKEKAREERARIKEEEKVKREIELKKKQLLVEKNRFLVEQNELQDRLLSEKDNEIIEQLKRKLLEMENHLKNIDNEENDLDYRLANTRAGYVYIISNIGSFGENIYKIGMTRRQEPQDRVKELGDASVPFIFDTHAMIFSEDAYTLESNLHKHFDNRRVNKINLRKEYFKVTLNEIKDVVKNKFDKPVEFIDVPEAIQFRESLIIENGGFTNE